MASPAGDTRCPYGWPWFSLRALTAQAPLMLQEAFLGLIVDEHMLPWMSLWSIFQEVIVGGLACTATLSVYVTIQNLYRTLLFI